jgi:hypothetical protein
MHSKGVQGLAEELGRCEYHSKNMIFHWNTRFVGEQVPGTRRQPRLNPRRAPAIHAMFRSQLGKHGGALSRHEGHDSPFGLGRVHLAMVLFFIFAWLSSVSQGI